MVTTQTPTLSPVDAERASERNAARDNVWLAAFGTVLFSGLFLLLSFHPTLPQLFPMALPAGFGFLFMAAVCAARISHYFLWIQDYQLSELRAIAANTERPNWQQLPPNS